MALVKTVLSVVLNNNTMTVTTVKTEEIYVFYSESLWRYALHWTHYKVVLIRKSYLKKGVLLMFWSGMAPLEINCTASR